MSIKNTLTIWFGKLMVKTLHLLGRDAGNAPGLVLWELNKDCLKAFKVDCPIIAVTGTNGKTSVTNYLNHIFESTGKKIITNKQGNNLDTGITSLLLQNCDMKGRVKADYLVLEVDESHVPVIFSKMKLETLVLLNFFRDQLDRNGEVETLILKVKKFLETYEGNVVLNADDLMSCYMLPENERVYFGIEKLPTDTVKCHNLIDDLQICPKCDNKLKYEYRRYSNIGKAHCVNCGFGSPEPDYSVGDVDYDNMTFTYRGPGFEEKLPLIDDRLVNLYNETALITLLLQLGYSIEEIKEQLSKVEVTKSRFNYETVGSMRVYNVLGKGLNAFAESRVYETIVDQPGDKELIMLINDLSLAAHWSENISWIYDTDFETLNVDSIKKIVVFGDRGLDYRLRMLFAGIPEEKIVHVNKAEDAIRQVDILPNMNYYVLYGADPGSFALGNKQAKTLVSILKEKSGETLPPEETEPAAVNGEEAEA